MNQLWWSVCCRFVGSAHEAKEEEDGVSGDHSREESGLERALFTAISTCWDPSQVRVNTFVGRLWSAAAANFVVHSTPACGVNTGVQEEEILNLREPGKSPPEVPIPWHWFSSTY